MFCKDIVGTGRTMKVLLNNIEKYKPKMIKVARWVKRSQNLVINCSGPTYFPAEIPIPHSCFNSVLQHRMGSSAERLPESLRRGWRKGEEMLLYCSAVAMTPSAISRLALIDFEGKHTIFSLPLGYCRRRSRKRTVVHMAQELFDEGDRFLCIIQMNIWIFF